MYILCQKNISIDTNKHGLTIFRILLAIKNDTLQNSLNHKLIRNIILIYEYIFTIDKMI